MKAFPPPVLVFLFYFLAKDCQGRALHWPGKRESPVLTGGRGESRASHLETLSGDGETSAKRLGSKLWHISSAVDITFYSYSMLGNEGSASKSARVPSTTLLPPDNQPMAVPCRCLLRAAQTVFKRHPRLSLQTSTEVNERACADVGRAAQMTRSLLPSSSQNKWGQDKDK